MKNIELRIYAPTNTKGLRFRLIGISENYIAFDYKFNMILDQAREILEDLGYKNKIASIRTTKKGYFIQIVD